MDEADALCNRLAIMARGQFKCIGSSRHIKEKFGKYLNLIIKCKKEIEPSNDLEILERFITKHIPEAQINGKQSSFY